MIRRQHALWLAAALGPALLAACARQATPQEAGEPTLSISSPAEGDSISGPVRLEVAVEGAEIGAHDSGGMLHVYVDDSKEYEAVTSTETMLGVPDGTHTIRVVLSDANHQETSVSDSVSVSVSGAPPTVCCGLPKQTGGPEDPGGTGETDDGTADTGGGGYDYNY